MGIKFWLHLISLFLAQRKNQKNFKSKKLSLYKMCKKIIYKTWKNLSNQYIEPELIKNK